MAQRKSQYGIKMITEFKKIVGAENVLTEKEDILPYAYDGTSVLWQMPRAVVFPQNSEQVAAVLKYANEKRIPIVPRGNGSGLSGGSLPLESGDAIVVCLTQMDHLLELDTQNLTMLVEAGMRTQTLFELVDNAGLFYPPDPGSMKISTIGGNIAENSGGLRGLKYGVTRNYVMGLEVVLPNGEIVWMGNKCVKDVAGFNLKDLFIGSEGLLGIITKALLRLVPPPKSRKTMLAIFEKMEDAAKTVSDIIAAHIIPCTLEFLDKTTIACVESYSHIGLPLDCEAVLLMETDGHASVVDEEADRMCEIANSNGCRNVRIAADDAEAKQLAEGRRVSLSALAKVSPTTILEDVTVPRSKLVNMVKAVQEIAQKQDLKVGIFGHFGDGNLHPTFLIDEKNEDEMKRVELAFDDIFKVALQLGGSVTGEHGVGLSKKKVLPQALGEQSIQLMRFMKKALDPNGILNPGKMFDL